MGADTGEKGGEVCGWKRSFDNFGMIDVSGVQVNLHKHRRGGGASGRRLSGIFSDRRNKSELGSNGISGSF